MSDQDEQKAPRILPSKRSAKRAVILGILLPLICRALPAELHHPCDVVAGVVQNICTGGLL